MASITATQHTALLDALDALWDKQIALGCRGEAESMEYLVTQYHVIRDLLDHATIKAVDAQPLWRDRDREDWMNDGADHLELVAAPYVTVGINPAGIESGDRPVVIEDADEMVAILPEHLPALIATLQEVQRRIGGDSC